ncbi:MAG TPA: TIGR01777 family oxidoreductase [Oscillatoriaceae cyanobacterium]
MSRKSRMPVSAEELYAWHARPGAFERLIPPWEDIRAITRTGGLADGAETCFELHKGPLAIAWHARHEDHRPAEGFTDVQITGPFAAWRHVHRFFKNSPDTSALEDVITYALPGGPLGDWLAGPSIHASLERTLAFRHRRTRVDLERHARFAARGPRRVLVTGASGLVGSALVSYLSTAGHEVVRLVRRAAGPGEIAWNPERGELEPRRLEGFDAVVHLAGESIAAGRWSVERKARILESRALGTALLARALAECERPPEVLIAASAIGIYGDRPAEPVDEDSPSGDGFLPDVCRRWEAATEPARAAGIRVVNLRLGVVLSPKGGALSKLLPPFQLGLGGPIGDGRQGMSWIALDDVLGAVEHAIFTPALVGPVNATAPMPESNAAFARDLGTVLGRPAFMPLPAPIIEAAFGEMGRALLLEGARVLPTRLLASGFVFTCPSLPQALRSELGLEVDGSA